MNIFENAKKQLNANEPDMTDRPEALAYLFGERNDFRD